MRSDVVQSFADLSGILGEAAKRIRGGMPLASLAEDLAAAANASADDLSRLAPSATPWNRGILVMLGDKSVFEQTQAQVTPPTVVDVHGDPLAVSPRRTSPERHDPTR